MLPNVAKSDNCPHDHILAYSVKDACLVSSLGRTALYALIANGKLEVRRVGRRTLVPAESLRRLIEQGA